MASDIFTHAYGRYAHKTTYNVAYGDGSVLPYTDVKQRVEEMAADYGDIDSEVFGQVFDAYYVSPSK